MALRLLSTIFNQSIIGVCFIYYKITQLSEFPVLKFDIFIVGHDLVECLL